MQEIADYFGVPLIALNKNYRLPTEIAQFAQFFCDDPNFVNRCVKKGGVKPIFVKCQSPEEELLFIIEMIDRNNLDDVGILLPFKEKEGKAENVNLKIRNIEFVKEKFDLHRQGAEYKLSKGEYSLDFSTTNPKVITFDSAKGLQFENVFIPFADYPPSPWFPSYYRSKFFVALTRTTRNLYLTHSSEDLSFYNRIPKEYYSLRSNPFAK